MSPEEIEALIPVVRGIIGDDTAPYDYSDEQITVLLNSTSGNVLITSALLLERSAQVLAVRYMSVATDDLKVDGKAAASLLLSRAQALRDEDAANEAGKNDDAFEVVYPFGNPYESRFEYTERPRWVY